MTNSVLQQALLMYEVSENLIICVQKFKGTLLLILVETLSLHLPGIASYSAADKAKVFNNAISDEGILLTSVEQFVVILSRSLKGMMSKLKTYPNSAYTTYQFSHIILYNLRSQLKQMA